MEEKYLAIDIGASSGRIITGVLHNKKIYLEEIYRFKNEMKIINDTYYWDLEKLFNEILEGLIKSREIEFIPDYIGIDTWGVDFTLVNPKSKDIPICVAYRDKRTDGMIELFEKRISREILYYLTGIQTQKFNSLYQLLAYRQKNSIPNYYKFLMIPDYLNYKLTGKISNEYTNATTTQLLNSNTKKWDWKIIDNIDVEKEVFNDIVLPKTINGNFLPNIKDKLGYDTQVVSVASHDTASAVIAVPMKNSDGIYISSGTWSLIGVELKKPICSDIACRYNFTNEGGIEHTIRFQKNIMGLWMIQRIKEEIMNDISFKEMVNIAKAASYFESVINVNDEVFLNPPSMYQSIVDYLQDTNQEIPKINNELLFCIYNSLAVSYKNTIDEIEQITGKKYKNIYIVGGGSQNHLLNSLTAKYCNKRVYYGPTEATAIGNIICQMMASKKIRNLEHARKIIRRSFEIGVCE